MFDSRDVAAYIAQQCIQNGYTYNNTKIQKLMYCAYGAVLAVTGKKLCEETPKAWQYGPVFPSVFRAISKGVDLAQYSYVVRNEAATNVLRLIDKAVSIFGKHNAATLTAWSHKPNSPWDTIVNHGPGLNAVIPDHLIVDYFKAHVMEPSDYA